jgi:hypothetical protein
LQETKRKALPIEMVTPHLFIAADKCRWPNAKSQWLGLASKVQMYVAIGLLQTAFRNALSEYGLIVYIFWRAEDTTCR